MNKIKFLFLLPAILAVFTACGMDEELPDPILSESDPVVTSTPTPEPSVQASETPSANIVVEDDSQ